MSFRQKLVLSYVAIFLVCLVLLFPLAGRIVGVITRQALEEKTDTVAAIVQETPDLKVLIEKMESQPPLFYRVSIIKSNGELVYDSERERFGELLPPGEYLGRNPELQEALKSGEGYGEFYSTTVQQDLVYLARRLDYHGQTLLLRTAFPASQVDDVIDRFQIGFIILGVVLLLLLTLFTFFIGFQLSRPIGKIINAIRPYQSGEIDHLPTIDLGDVSSKDDFSRLAGTLNGLSERVEAQFRTLKNERNEKDTLLASLVEGVVAVDPDMRVTYVNPMATEMLAREPLVGQHFDSAGQPELSEMLERCQEQEEMLASTAQLGRYLIDAIAVPKGADSGAVLVLQDKSVHYRLLEMRKDFIANASHELKTPITIILGFAEAIHDNPGIDAREMTDKIIRNCRRMDTLVKNLLRLADIENLPRGKLQRCDLSALTHACRMMVLDVYPDAQIEIEADDSTEMIADPDLLELAITNLLDNAAKYSTPPAQVQVSIKVLQPERQIHMVVADKGIGIPEADLDQIFQRFYTVDKAHSRKMGGSGLGLSIVKTIVEKHFGRISVESKVGEGSAFTLILPQNLEERT